MGSKLRADCCACKKSRRRCRGHSLMAVTIVVVIVVVMVCHGRRRSSRQQLPWSSLPPSGTAPAAALAVDTFLHVSAAGARVLVVVLLLPIHNFRGCHSKHHQQHSFLAAAHQDTAVFSTLCSEPLLARELRSALADCGSCPTHVLS